MGKAVRMRDWWELYRTFFRIGLFTFGGGYAMLPMLQREVVEKKQWASEEDMLDYYAIGQCTPGVIAVNTATFIGYKKGGVAGSIFATLGVISPSLVIITLIAAFFRSFGELAVVRHAFAGIRVAVTVLIGTSVVKIAKKSLVDLPTILIAAAVLLVNLFLNVSPVICVIVSAAAGVLIRNAQGRAKA